MPPLPSVTSVADIVADIDPPEDPSVACVDPSDSLFEFEFDADVPPLSPQPSHTAHTQTPIVR